MVQTPEAPTQKRQVREPAVVYVRSEPDKYGKYHKVPRYVSRTFGLALTLYAISHAGPGMEAASGVGSAWVVWGFTLAWAVASTGLFTGGLGVLGMPLFRGVWRRATSIGAIASMLLILASWQIHLWPMLILDYLFLVTASVSSPYDPEQELNRQVSRLGRFLSGVGQLVAMVSLLYGLSAILVRPLHQNWGATRAEIERVFPREDARAPRRNLINHVVNVNAPPKKVYQWMIELGQDRAGFFSYDWLERAVGDDVHNRFVIKPEWQRLQEGDFIPAVQPGYLWGAISSDNLGWKVEQLTPNRLMHLRNWGYFWIEPDGDGRCRFGVRSTIGDVPFWVAPIQVFAFEPAHFIMEQKMLTTIKALAENNHEHS